MKYRLDRAVQITPSWTLHDLRRTVETRMAGLGVPQEHIGQMMNHGVALLTRTYNQHEYRGEKAAALQRWSRRTGPHPSAYRLRRTFSGVPTAA